jgi:hypothetical protein
MHHLFIHFSHIDDLLSRYDRRQQGGKRKQGHHDGPPRADPWHTGTREASLEKMTPAVERLVRLVILLDEPQHPLWDSLIADCGDASEVMSMRWFVGDAARMWPEAGPRNLAEAVLSTFSAASEATLRMVSDALLGGPGKGPQVGAAWVTQASAAAIDVLAQHPSAEQVLEEVKEHWSLG